MLRRVSVAVLLACAALAALAAAAGASPQLRGIGVGLPCANPANHGHSGRVLPPARVTIGGDLACDGQAINAGQGPGPTLMKGPVGYGPAQLQSAYGVAGLTSGGRTVAIVDAFDDPKAAADLAVFRSTYGLPACSTGCFTKISQTGSTLLYPKKDNGWSEEISLDLDTVSMICPDCHILLVEANSATTANLAVAENEAAKQPGVVAISNSYGGAEASSELAGDANYNHPGIAITASTGDSGYGVQWPAASPFVTAVGGTSLSSASNSRGWTETAWSGAGSGCSAFEAKPAWQLDPGCAKRTVADVSADADPNTGVGIYDTQNGCGSSSFCDSLIELGLVQGLDGWAQVGGTSLSSPLIASVYALAGNSASINYGSFPYAHTSSLNDVISGSNGTCTPTYLCTAGSGYDGPTGLGTPIGTGAF
jgi:subtilase family serine protease